MNNKLRLVVTGGLLSLAFMGCKGASVTNSAVKSEYPGDYAVGRQCQSVGPAEVCRAYQMGYGLAVLDIYYTSGVLLPASVSAFVQVDYQNGPVHGIFPRLSDQPTDRAHIRVTGGCLVGVLGGCATSGTPAMRDLLQWAARAGSVENALDLELAFVDAAGNWDSNFGANYKVHFDQYGTD